MRPSCYLAGPIRGLNYNDATEWRDKAKAELDAAGIDAFSPMRAKKYLASDKSIDSSDANYSMFPLSVPPAVVCRDHHDCTKRDALIVYLKGAKAISIGTIFEIAWAYDNGIPIILVMEKEGNVNEHMFVRQCCKFQVETLEEAIFIAKAVLLP